MQISRYNRISEWLIVAYLAFLSIFILTFRGFITAWLPLLAAQAAAGTVLIVLVKVQSTRPDQPVLRVIRNWLPLPYILFGYKMVHFLINSDRNPGFMTIRDGWLIAADRYLFGGDPTVWLQRITDPWLTELMQIVYAANYFLPLILVLALYLKRERIPFQQSVFVITLGYFLSFLGYFIIPAIGPRFTILHRVPLQGVFIRETLERLNYCLDSCPRDCFPSGHTEIPLLTLWLASRFQRGLFRVYLPIVAVLVCSTVYLRYHYVVDVLAGMALAGIVIVLAKKAERRMGKRRSNVQPPTLKNDERNLKSQ
ncbi:MAG: phosphatase PAP2 family protein [PVC group bacterium]